MRDLRLITIDNDRKKGLPMRRHRRVKLLATLGPASNNAAMAAKLFEAGVDVFRLNMSHLPREKLPEQVAMLRALEGLFRRPVGILVDLQGPKLRVGAFADEAGLDEIFLLLNRSL